jgi:hypothetical protein
MVAVAEEQGATDCTTAFDGGIYRVDFKMLSKASGMTSARVKATLREWEARDFCVAANDA